ncbi:hypothetical protein BH11ARM2_BH11ARM2_02850 [soil metagenome]
MGTVNLDDRGFGGDHALRAARELEEAGQQRLQEFRPYLNRLRQEPDGRREIAIYSATGDERAEGWLRQKVNEYAALPANGPHDNSFVLHPTNTVNGVKKSKKVVP